MTVRPFPFVLALALAFGLGGLVVWLSGSDSPSAAQAQVQEPPAVAITLSAPSALDESRTGVPEPVRPAGRPSLPTLRVQPSAPVHPSADVAAEEAPKERPPAQGEATASSQGPAKSSPSPLLAKEQNPLGIILMGDFDPDLPLMLRALLVKKTLQHLKPQPVDPVTVYVAGENAEVAQLSALAQAFVEAELPAQALIVAPDGELPELGTNHVVYFVSEPAAVRLSTVCEEHDVVSFAHDAGLVMQGAASLAFGLKPDGRPDIFLNPGRLDAEGHELSAQVLAIATLVE